MKYSLDANMVILLLTGTNDHLRDRVTACDDGEIALSAIAFAEIALGSWNGRGPSVVVLDQLKRLLPIQPFDEAAAKTYAQLPFKRGSFDRLIAAHTLSLGLILVTNNERDFADIPGLRVENWTQ